MITIVKRGGRALMMAMGVMAATSLAFAVPASAAAGDTSSFGAECTGLVVCGPFAASAYPAGPASNTLLSVSVPTLLTTGAVNTTATATGATASVDTVSLTLAALTTLTATAVSSECTINAAVGSVAGSSSIVGGSISLLSGLPLTLATAPAPNTVVTVPGVASVTLNRQVVNPDGSLTVDAIFISLLNSTQTVTLASSTCAPAAVGVPAIAPAFAGGAGVLGMSVLGFYLYRRQQTPVRINE